MNSKLKSNFSKLFIGNVGAQLISLAFYPLITRIYSPLEFGVFGVFNSIVQVITIYSSGQLHIGMLSQKDPEERKHLFSLALILNALSFLFLLFVFIGLYFADLIEPFYLLMPLAVFFYGLMEVHKMWAVAEEKLGIKSILININRLSSNLLKLVGSTSLILILSEIVSNFLAVIMFLYYSKKDLLLKNSWSKSRELLVRYKNYPLFFTFYLLSQVLSTEAITIYIQKFLSTSEVGIFFLGNKLFVQTALIVSSTLSYSFNHLMAEGHDARQRIYQKTLGIYVLGLIAALVLWIPDYSLFVNMFFGEKWLPLSQVMNFFIILTPVKIFMGFFAYIVLLSGHTRFISIFKFVQFVCLLLFLQMGFNNLKEFLWIFVPFEIVCDTLFIICGYVLVRRAR